ncbi:hypothetical protein L596_009479 [Steinernema carpocapsae]|uniref:Uncharacterized protein n=1 Tax=Steinernema carpocapsae TaxID=34508 RepID=A0A4U5PFR4_STECR|nr:hypothetical protein L596_009479 [Steinernema carpocapsae]
MPINPPHVNRPTFTSQASLADPRASLSHLRANSPALFGRLSQSVYPLRNSSPGGAGRSLQMADEHKNE